MTTQASTPGVRAYSTIDIAWQRLQEFLGDDFDPRLTDYATCCEFVEEEFVQLGATFYDKSVGYPYELTHFHFSGYKDSFFEVVTKAAVERGLRNLGDVGCGIGLDAQALVARGYHVTLYEFEAPSACYATWRLHSDGYTDTIVATMDKLGREQHDLVYAVDVLEHIPSPELFVSRLFSAGRYVCVNFFEHDPSAWDGKDMHFPLDHRRLLPEFSRYGELIQLAISGATITSLWKGHP